MVSAAKRLAVPDAAIAHSCLWCTSGYYYTGSRTVRPKSITQKRLFRASVLGDMPDITGERPFEKLR